MQPTNFQLTVLQPELYVHLPVDLCRGDEEVVRLLPLARRATGAS
jgi:hypothetical protein